MKLPRPKHTYLNRCDPMCSDCQEWMDDIQERVEPAVIEARKAFWNVIRAWFPGIPYEALAPAEVEEFAWATLEAVERWAENGLKEYPQPGSVVGIAQLPLFADSRPLVAGEER